MVLDGARGQRPSGLATRYAPASSVPRVTGQPRDAAAAAAAVAAVATATAATAAAAAAAAADGIL